MNLPAFCYPDHHNQNFGTPIRICTRRLMRSTMARSENTTLPAVEMVYDADLQLCSVTLSNQRVRTRPVLITSH